MPKSRTTVRSDVREQILTRLKEGGIPVSQLAEEHGVSTRVIYHWLAKGVESPPSLHEFVKLKKQNQALALLLGQLTLELSASKKKSSGAGGLR